MKISLLGPGSETLLVDFDSSGVEYIKKYPPSGSIQNAGDTIQILQDISGIIPWKTIAAVIVAWLKIRNSRMATVTTKDNRVIHLKGLSSKEVEKILPHCINMIAAETEKTNE
jgi:hypothetical protein